MPPCRINSFIPYSNHQPVLIHSFTLPHPAIPNQSWFIHVLIHPYLIISTSSKFIHSSINPLPSRPAWVWMCTVYRYICLLVATRKCWAAFVTSHHAALFDGWLAGAFRRLFLLKIRIQTFGKFRNMDQADKSTRIRTRWRRIKNLAPWKKKIRIRW